MKFQEEQKANGSDQRRMEIPLKFKASREQQLIIIIVCCATSNKVNICWWPAAFNKRQKSELRRLELEARRSERLFVF